jgi:hypothetical protein
VKVDGVNEVPPAAKAPRCVLHPLQLHRVHVPGGLDSENAPIEFTILHLWNSRTPSPSDPGNPLQSRNSQNSRVGVCLGGAWEVCKVEVTARVRRVAETGLWGADEL